MKKKVDENALLREGVKKMLSVEDVTVHHYYGEHLRFGVLSDTHIGSLYFNRALLHMAYKTFKKEGITSVYHCGDICDGESMYRVQEYELYAHGADKQVKEVIEKYPKFDGIKTFFITGNHDLSFYKKSGIDIGEHIAMHRKDLIYLGQEEMDIALKRSGHPKIRLSHPGKGTSYALSYHAQKYVESLSGGQKPDAVFIGHFHKAEHIPCLRNIQVIQAGAIQRQTPFMRNRNLAAHQGFWIIDMWLGKNDQPKRFRGEFFPYYEKKRFKVLEDIL